MNTNPNSYHNHCLICNSQKIHSIKGYEAHFLMKCSDCQFVFSGKIPTIEELNNHYEGYGRNDYLSPITIKRYNEILDQFEPFRKTNRLLDVGCGIGYFLEVAKKRGWEVYGTEFTDQAVQICKDKGIQMHQGVLNPENYEEEQFDVITSFEVIEHINNPKEEIENIFKILKKGGLVYITTPNFNSLLRYYLKDNYNVICYPEHLSYYTPKTIKQLFKSCGFKSLKIETTGFSVTRLKTSEKKSDEKFISKDSSDEKLRQKFDENKKMAFLKNCINSTLTLLGTGDALKASFIKM